jgi:hypothetical protein
VNNVRDSLTEAIVQLWNQLGNAFFSRIDKFPAFWLRLRSLANTNYIDSVDLS